MRPPDRPATYWPALDGLRAVAVVAVFAYHASPSTVPRGGAVGVTAFFALSGFLITTLLLRERNRDGRISLLGFYRRRALRLLPAIVVLVAATTAWASLTDTFPRTIDAAVPVLTYVFNWFRAFPADGGTSYGLLEHTWSLSVEEQFYVVWPLAVLGAVAVAGATRHAEAVAVVSAAGIAASLAWRLTLWDVDAERRSAARLYNGTDTVADQLLIGAFVAAVLVAADRAGRPLPPKLARLVGTWAAPAAMAALAWVALFRPGGFTLANDRRYLEWGSLAFAAATCVIVVACTRAPDTWLARLLSWRPLTAIGVVSYGIYLWHYPVILVVDDAWPDLARPVQAVVVVAATAAVVTASWRFVERPFLARKRPGPSPTTGPDADAVPAASAERS